MSELERSWGITRQHLTRARAELPDQASVTSAVAEYEEFLHHNELELAMDSLAVAGERGSPTPEFWRALSRAAACMQLHDRADALLRRAR